MENHYARDTWGQILCDKNRWLLVRRTDKWSRVTCKRCLRKRTKRGGGR